MIDGKKVSARSCRGCGRMIVWGQRGENGKRIAEENQIKICFDCAARRRKEPAK